MSTRIKEARKAAGISQEKLAELTGQSQQSVSAWEKGWRRPQMEALRIIAQVCNTTVDYLLEITDNPSKPSENPLPRGVVLLSDMPRHTVPVLGSVAAGEPIFMSEDYDVYVDSVQDADFALKVSGNSMNPTYLDGDVIYIKTVPDVDDGQVCVVAVDDSATLKHLYHIPGGVQLVSDNPAYKPMIFTQENSESVRVLGVPVGYTRLFKRPKK